MKTKTKYGPIEPAKPRFEPRGLLIIPHRNEPLTVSSFRPNIYLNNLQEMQGNFSCLPEYPQVSFRPATTSESISAAVYEFEKRAKPQILDAQWLQLGWGVKTSEGVFVNPPKYSQGNPIINEKTLKSLLDKAKEVNGIYLADNDFGFAPYETFKQGYQDSVDFAEGGLARVLEHTEDKTSENLRNISSPQFYVNGVHVWGFSSVKEPVLIVPALDSGWYVDDHWLCVVGYRGDGWGGCAFGVKKAGEASRAENKLY